MFGDEDQKRTFLPRLVKGEVLGAWGLTEAGAGSDAAGMRTSAVRDGERWVLEGSKNFITHGRIGGVFVVMAVTDRSKGHRGISAFIVEHGTPGMSAGKKENKLGMRASDTSEVVFQDCRLPASQLLGEEGQGFINTLQVLDAGRIGIAALSVGLAQGAYEAALRYAQERKAFGRTISRPVPIAKPLLLRPSGVVVRPRKAVRSAKAGSGVNRRRVAAISSFLIAAS
jgi:alkylation response protein AidB-like acyl-CoA dehydrogenase